MKNANVIEGFGCRQGAWAAFAFCSSRLQLDAAARLDKNGAVAQINATGIGVLEKGGRTAATRFFYVRRMATRVLGGCVGSPSGLAGSFPGTPTRTVALPIGVGRAVLESLERSTAMSTTKTPAKGKSRATPKKPTRRTLPAPTPASIHALFVALRTLGWRSGLEHAHSHLRRPPDPVPVDARTPLPSAEQVEALFVMASQWGWAPISYEEAAVIHDMKCLTMEGIEHFKAVAVCIRQNHPWEPSTSERYAGAYKVPHYASRELPPAAPATPREEALFAVLRHVGIHAASQRSMAPLRPPTMPDPDATIPILSRTKRDAIDAFGRELGWAWLAPRYLNLVELLRCCDDKGRAILLNTLSALLRRHRQGN